MASKVFLKILYLVFSYRKYTRILIFQNVPHLSAFRVKGISQNSFKWWLYRKYTRALTFENLWSESARPCCKCPPSATAFTWNTAMISAAQLLQSSLYNDFVYSTSLLGHSLMVIFVSVCQKCRASTNTRRVWAQRRNHTAQRPFSILPAGYSSCNNTLASISQKTSTCGFKSTYSRVLTLEIFDSASGQCHWQYAGIKFRKVRAKWLDTLNVPGHWLSRIFISILLGRAVPQDVDELLQTPSPCLCTGLCGYTHTHKHTHIFV